VRCTRSTPGLLSAAAAKLGIAGQGALAGAAPKSPAGAVTGSIGSGDPLRVLRRSRGWRRVATEFGATGWVPRGNLCG
jgi:hypothetical protein